MKFILSYQLTEEDYRSEEFELIVAELCLRMMIVQDEMVNEIIDAFCAGKDFESHHDDLGLIGCMAAKLYAVRREDPVRVGNELGQRIQSWVESNQDVHLNFLTVAA